MNDTASGTVSMVKDATNGFDNIAGNVYKATVNSAGSVLTGPGETVTASSITVSASSGTIGTSCTSPYAINTASLTANAGGSAYFSDSFNSTTTAITVTSSSVGSSGTFFLKSTSATAGSGNILTNGTGITGSSGGIAGQVDIITVSGSIGTSSAPIVVKAANLSLQASSSGQNVYANDTATGTVTMIKDSSCNCDNIAGGVYSVTADNGVFVKCCV